MAKTNSKGNAIKKLFTTCIFGLIFISSLSFAAEFGDHCTYSLSEGRLFKTQCLISTVYEGKSYCFGTEAGKDEFLENPKAMIAKAQAFYEKQPLASGTVDIDGRTKISQADLWCLS